MEGEELSIPRYFIKIMMPGFHQQLNLPPNVSKELKKQKSRKATLRSRIGTWRIGFCRNRENGLICLKKGWPQFVKRHALTLCELVCFEHTGDLRFNVSVFNTNLCENEFRDEEEEKEEEDQTLNPMFENEFGNEVEEKEEETQTLNPTNIVVEDEEEESMSFEKTMIPTYATKLAMVNIPLGFMRSNNLSGRHTGVVLRDCSEREWDVKLTAGNSDGIRFRMRGEGWLAFYASNALKNGDTCVFRLNRRFLTSTIVFDVKIIRDI